MTDIVLEGVVGLLRRDLGLVSSFGLFNRSRWGAGTGTSVGTKV